MSLLELYCSHLLTRPLAEVFEKGSDLQEVVDGWMRAWDNNQATAMCDFINFVIKCTGCSLQIDNHDIEDPDNVVGKLTDLQEEYQQQKPTDYPLVAKVRGMASFRSTMTGFIETFIQTCHANGYLYKDLSIIENIEIWVSTMSSSSIRPFRHTATVISLTIGNEMCKVASDIAESNAKTLRLKEGEKNKKSVNKQCVKELDEKIADLDRKYAQTKESMQAIFDTVFVHRYRDVDPKIRVDCVAALGIWILTLPEVFFEGIYLRYLGWVLSDLYAPTRAEVLKQLIKLFKNKENVARLRTFTERFRGRLVEIALRDSEVGIRASAVELLDLIRETELLEPDDIDNIGRLIFDTEPRVRKAVAKFFAANIDDLYETTAEDFGGQEGLAEVLGEEQEDDYNAPRSSWLTIKCIAEAVQSYDTEDEGDGPLVLGERDVLQAGADSRFRLAAQTIHDGTDDAKDWEALAGYLLHDFSSTGHAPPATNTAFLERCRLSEKEEIFLLELLNVAVKGRLLTAASDDSGNKNKSAKQKKDDFAEVQEATTLQLAEMMPKLLKKFGPNSSTASAVLRLGSTMNLKVFQELRQDSTTYVALLDDVNRQFLTHADQDVLAEATGVLLHAREFNDLAEVTENKAQELWNDTINNLRSLMTQGVRGHSSAIRDSILRVAYLGGVADCVAILEAPGRSGKGRKGGTHAHTASPLTLLLDLIKEPELDQDASEAPEILTGAMKVIQLYYMWQAFNMKTRLDAKQHLKEFPDFSLHTDAFAALAERWPANSAVRLAACSTILDLYTLFAQFRNQQLPDNVSIPHIPHPTEKIILSTHSALEKAYAKIAHKIIGDALVDDDPASEEEEDILPESDDEDEDNVVQKDKQRASLYAEKSLCELSSKMVLAIIGRVLDNEGPSKGRIRKRLEHNRSKLGSNYKEIIAYLDSPKVKSGKKKAPLAAAAAAKKAVASRSAEMVRDEDDEEEEEEEEEDEEAAVNEEGGEEDLRNRELMDDRIADPEDDREPDPEIAGEEIEDDIIGD